MARVAAEEFDRIEYDYVKNRVYLYGASDRVAYVSLDFVTSVKQSFCEDKELTLPDSLEVIYLPQAGKVCGDVILSLDATLKCTIISSFSAITDTPDLTPQLT